MTPATEPSETADVRVGGGFAAVALILDQGLNTVSNFVVVALVGRALSVHDFGLFALVQIVSLLLQFGAQAALSDQLLRETDVDRARSMSTAIAASFFRLAAGYTIVLAVLTAVGVVQSSYWSAAIGFGALYTLWIAFVDLVRSALYTQHSYRLALGLDAGLAALQISLLIVVNAAGELTARWVWLWLALPFCALAVLARYRVAAIRAHVTYAGALFKWRYAVEAMSTVAASQIALVVASATIGATFMGQYRASLLLVGPATALITLARPLLLPRFSRPEQVREGVLLTAGLLGVCAAWGAIALALPVSVRRAVVGQSGANVGDLLLPTAVAALTTALFIFMGLYYRAQHEDRATTLLRLGFALGNAGALVLCVIYSSPEILIWGFAASPFVAIAFIYIPKRRRAEVPTAHPTAQAGGSP